MTCCDHCTNPIEPAGAYSTDPDDRVLCDACADMAMEVVMEMREIKSRGQTLMRIISVLDDERAEPYRQELEDLTRRQIDLARDWPTAIDSPGLRAKNPITAAELYALIYPARVTAEVG